jgi:hypothetical protein
VECCRNFNCPPRVYLLNNKCKDLEIWIGINEVASLRMNEENLIPGTTIFMSSPFRPEDL